MLESARVDRWTWAVRLYKTRSLAAAACESGHVTVNGATVKPSAKVRVGDRVEARVGQWHRVVDAVQVIDTRVSAARAADCVIDRSPPPPEREQPLGVPTRERGSGRPTKRDRRVLDQLRGENDKFAQETPTAALRAERDQR